MASTTSRDFVPSTCRSALRILSQILHQFRQPIFRAEMTVELLSQYQSMHRDLSTEVNEALREIGENSLNIQFTFGPFTPGGVVAGGPREGKAFYDLYNQFHLYIHNYCNYAAGEELERWLQMWLQLVRDVDRGLFESERVYCLFFLGMGQHVMGL